MEKMDFENTASSLPTQILWAFLVQKILEPFKEDFMATLLPQFWHTIPHDTIYWPKPVLT